MGLRCLLRVALAGRRSGSASDPRGEAVDAPVPIAQIAEDEGISGVYAAKLMRQLRLAGLVESTRGSAGGYALSRPADAISVWDAIHALDDSFLPDASCGCDPVDRIDCRRTTSCSVSSLWRSLGAEIRAKLEAVSLAELCAGSIEGDERVALPVLDVQRRDAGRFGAPSDARKSGPGTVDDSTNHERSLTWSHSN